MKKRTLGIILVLAMALTLLPILPNTAQAADTTDMRQNIVSVALSQEGYKEKGENLTKYGSWYGADRAPWCAIFVSWCARMAGVPESVIPNFAACNSGGVSWFKNNGTWKDRSYTPQPGDIVFYDDASGTGVYDGRAEHVGIVVSADANTITAVEGNASDMVVVKTYVRTSAILGYGVPNYGALSGKSCDMTLTDLDCPEIVWKGEACSVSGTVKSDYSLIWLYAELRNENNQFCSYGYCAPGTTSANISMLSSSLKYSSLSVGNYYLYIEAVDSEYNMKTWLIPFGVYTGGYEIKYDALGGTPVPKTQKKLADTSVTISEIVPQRDDYIFIGWSTDKYASVPNYASGQEFSANATITLYAVWQRCEHKYEKGVCTVCNQAIVFKDVDTANWHKPYAEAISWAVQNDITVGYGQGQFKPNQACTRAQVVTFLWRAFGCPEPETTDNPFADVSNSGGLTPYYDAILWATENGIATGYPDGTFRPSDTCTRAQFVTFLWRAVGSPESEAANPFTDLDDNDFYDAILWAYEAGVTQGYSDGTFLPNKECSRAQVVTFIYRQMA